MAKPNTIQFETAIENRGPWNPRNYKPNEVAAALDYVRDKNMSDPFAVARAKNVLDRGVFRPSDILAGVSV